MYENIKTKSYGNQGANAYWAGKPIEHGMTWLQAILVQVLWKMWNEGIFIVENGVTC